MIEGTTIRAGIDPTLSADALPDGAEDYIAARSQIGSISIKGIKGQAKGTPTFLRSILAAWELGKVTLGSIDTDSGDGAFGLAAHAVKSIKGATAIGVLPKLTPAGLPTIGNFQLTLVQQGG